MYGTHVRQLRTTLTHLCLGKMRSSIVQTEVVPCTVRQSRPVEANTTCNTNWDCVGTQFQHLEQHNSCHARSGGTKTFQHSLTASEYTHIYIYMYVRPLTSLGIRGGGWVNSRWRGAGLCGGVRYYAHARVYRWVWASFIVLWIKLLIQLHRALPKACR